MRVKLYRNGYTKIYPNGKNISIAGSYETDEEVIEFLANDGVVEPEFTQAQLDQQVKDKRIAEIDARLDKIDILSIRSLRSKSNGRGNSHDDTKLAELDDEAIALRTERAILDT